MRIEELNLERYGPFTDRRLSFASQAALHVVFGANEAGKTSALSAIGDLLFGFGARTAYDFRHDARLLRIGGRLRHSSGQVADVRRRKGNKNTLVGVDDQPLPDDLLTPFLGGLSRETFNSEFGLTAEALREGGNELLEAGGRLAETLAAGSAGLSALSRARERLQREADELFTPRRSGNKAFYVAIDRREMADRALRDAIVSRDAVRQAERSVHEAGTRLNDLRVMHADLGGQLALWQRTLRTQSCLDRLDRLNEQLSSMEGLPVVSAHQLAEWHAAHDEHAELTRRIAALDVDDTTDRAEIGGLAVDERVLSIGPDVDALRERLGAVRKARDDLPRRRQAYDHAQTTLDELARRLGLPSHIELLGRLPNDPALTLARSLIAERHLAERAMTEADRRVAQAQERRQEVAAERSASPIVDVEHLRQRFDALGNVPARVERLGHVEAALSAEMASLRSAAAGLYPSPGSVEDLAGLSLPDAHVIGRQAQEWEAGRLETKRLKDAIAAIDDDIAAENVELQRLSDAGHTLTKSDLSRVRQLRDSQLEMLGNVLDGDQGRRHQHFAEVRRASETVDRVTDLLLGDAGRAARQDAVQHRLAAYRDERSRLVARLDLSEQHFSEVSRAWNAMWQASGVTPGDPADMLRWRERVDQLLARIEKHHAERQSAAALAESLEATRDAVIAFLHSTGRIADRTLSADILFREAKSRLDEMQAAFVSARERAVAATAAERELSEATQALERSRSALEDLQRRWPAGMKGIGLSAEATAVEAQAALDVWHATPAADVSFRRERRSVETIVADLQSFEQDVLAVLARAGGGPGPTTESAQETLAGLSDAVEQARRGNDAVKRLRDQLAQRATRRRGLVARRDLVADTLRIACRQLAVDDADGLLEKLDRIAMRHCLQADQNDVRRDIDQIGDGRDERALRQERSGLDLDLLPSDIERETVRHRQLLTEIEQASIVHHQAMRDLDALTVGRNAPAAAAERADANAALLSVAQGWLLRAAASRLASLAIERHRARVQDPLVSRAGGLFAAATNSAFAGLGIDYSQNDQPILVARRASGEHVLIEALSEGTRDQLFLALRLALLEQWPSEPVPFVGDDLLTSFDEPRALATLALLAAAGLYRQIILFTHHRHIVELAQSMACAVDVVEL